MYARRFADPARPQPGIHFLTGSPQQVARIASAVGFPYRYDKASDQFAHPAGFVVTTPGGKISRYMLGLNPAPGAAQAAVAEAAARAGRAAGPPLAAACASATIPTKARPRRWPFASSAMSASRRFSACAS